MQWLQGTRLLCLRFVGTCVSAAEWELGGVDAAIGVKQPTPLCAGSRRLNQRLER